MTNEKTESELKELTEHLVKSQRGRWTAMRTRYWDFDFRQAIEMAFRRGYDAGKREPQQ